jgi:hypothetical protein
MARLVIPDLETTRARDEVEFRLGARLRGEGLVTEEDLEEAIRQQVILGGHLTTNLWELGLVDGRILSQLSAELLRVPEPDPEELAGITPKTLALLPLEFVERARILPLGLRRYALRVATCEPWNHLALGEAGYHSGYPIEPSFVAEVPLMRLLAQHYGIPLRGRFRLPHPVVEPGKRGTSPASEEVPWDQLPELPDDVATIISVGTPATVAPVIPPATRVPEPAAEPDLEPIATLAEAQAALMAAEDRDGIGRALVRFALSRGARAILFVHRRGQWGGWLGAGTGLDSGPVRGLVVPAERGTIFGLVAETGAHFMGNLSAHPVHQRFLAALGEAIPGAIGLFPVHYRGRLALALYLDAGDHRDVATDVAEILVLAHRVPGAIERLVQRRLGER